MELKLNLNKGMVQNFRLCLPSIRRTNRHRRNPERHGRRNRRARSETVQGAAGQAGDDVRVVDPAKVSGAGGEGEVGVSNINKLERATQLELFPDELRQSPLAQE